MIADLILRLLGYASGEIDDPLDKWPTIFAKIINLSVPIVIILFFFSPLIFLKLRRKKFTAANVILAIVIGALLAYGVWLVNEWSYGFGQGVIFRQIYSDTTP